MSTVETFEVMAELRSDLGKGASRRLRHEDKIPAVLYGGEKPPVAITLSHNEISKHLQHEAFYSHILTLHLPEGDEKVILRDLQRHPYKPLIVHVDFQRVDATHTIHMMVPLHFINEEACVGVKQGRGTISHSMSEIEIECLPDKLPEFIEVDIAQLEVGKTLHLSELVLPEGVVIKALKIGHDTGVVTVVPPKGSSDTTEETAG